MLENENITEVSEEEDALLPDGWQEGDDFFTEDSWTGETQTDEPAEEPAQGSEEETAEAEEEAPTTEPDEPAGDTGDATEEAPTTEPTAEEEPHKLKFTARVDRADLDVEVEESELPTLYQKAQVTERVQAKLAALSPKLEKAEELSRSMGYDSLDAMLEAAEQGFRNTEVARLVAEGVHEEVAKDMVQRRMTERRAQAQASEQGATPPEDAPATGSGQGGDAPGGRDFRAEVQALLSARPDLQGQKLPDEVVKACARGGKSLVVAYVEYEAAQAKAEAERIRKENAVLKQNAASAAKAPVSGTQGGGATDTKPEDDFLRGFNDD